MLNIVMNSGTKKIVRAALEADRTVTAEQITAAFALLHGRTPEKKPMPLLLTQKQAAFLLGVSRYTLRRMTMKGQFHLVKVNDAYLYKRSEIEQKAAC